MTSHMGGKLAATITLHILRRMFSTGLQIIWITWPKVVILSPLEAMGGTAPGFGSGLAAEEG